MMQTVKQGLRNRWRVAALALLQLLVMTPAFASEADIQLPDLTQVSFSLLGMTVSGLHLMYFGLVVCVFGAIFGLVQYRQIRAIPVHESMENVSSTIYETCKTYLMQQGKFLFGLWLIIAACMIYYFGFLTAGNGEAGAGRGHHQHPRQSHLDPCRFGAGHPGLHGRGVVRHPNQYSCQ